MNVASLKKPLGYVLKAKIHYYVLAYSFIFLFGFLRIPLISRYLEPSELGSYALYSSISSYVDILFFSWLLSTSWRFVYDKSIRSLKHLISGIFPLFLALTFLGLLVVLILKVTFLKNYDIELLLLGLVLIVTQNIVSFYFFALHSQSNIFKWCLHTCLYHFICFFSIAAFVAIVRVGVASVFLGFIVCNLLFILFLTIKYFKRLSLSDLSADPELYRRMFSYSFLAVLINLGLMILNNGDRFIIDFYKGKSELGIYSQIYNLASTGLLSIIQIFNSIFSRPLNKSLANQDDHAGVMTLIQSYYLIFTPVVIFLIANNKIIVEFILGKKFAEHHLVFSWVIGSIYLYGLANFFEIRLKFLNKSKSLISAILVSVCLNILLNLVCLRYFKIESAAIITFLSYLLLTLLLIYLNKNFLHFPIRRKLFALSLFTLLVYILMSLFIQELVTNSWLLLSLEILLASVVYFVFVKKFFFVFKNSMSLITVAP